MANIHLMDFSGSAFDIVSNPKIKCVGKCCDDSFAAVAHAHTDAVEIVYLSKGKGAVMIADHTYPMETGSLALYNEGVLHREELYGEEGPLVMYHTRFDNFQVSALPKNQMVPADSAPMIDGVAISDFFDRCFEIMFDECVQKETGYGQICYALLQSIIAVTLRLIARGSVLLRPMRSDSLVFRVKEYVGENFHRKLTIKDIADEMNISYYRLSHAFRESCGVSLQSHLIARRIQAATEMLTETDTPVSLIASQVGYATQAHFYTQFKRAMRQSPIQYRKAQTESASQIANNSAPAFSEAPPRKINISEETRE